MSPLTVLCVIYTHTAGGVVVHRVVTRWLSDNPGHSAARLRWLPVHCGQWRRLHERHRATRYRMYVKQPTNYFYYYNKACAKQQISTFCVKVQRTELANSYQIYASQWLVINVTASDVSQHLLLAVYRTLHTLHPLTQCCILVNLIKHWRRPAGTTTRQTFSNHNVMLYSDPVV